MSKERGTFLVEFTDGQQIIFGNNYKTWWRHAIEFIYNMYASPELGWGYDEIKDKVKVVKYSNQPFYDDGGLKWCRVKNYQRVIDDVTERDELAPVSFEDIKFKESELYTKVLNKQLRKY